MLNEISHYLAELNRQYQTGIAREHGTFTSVAINRRKNGSKTEKDMH